MCLQRASIAKIAYQTLKKRLNICVKSVEKSNLPLHQHTKHRDLVKGVGSGVSS